MTPLISLFCGPGGMDEGFAKAGFDTVVAIDVDGDCSRTMALNHPQAAVQTADVRRVSLSDLDRLAGHEVAPVGVIGGPPCQSFSRSNAHQKEDDPRHDLTLAYANILRNLNDRNPVRFFLFENVPALRGKKHEEKYQCFKQHFADAGFSLHEMLLDAQDYGVPQVRERLFVLGLNQKAPPPGEFHMPEPCGLKKTVRDAIWGLPEPARNARGIDPDTLPMHPNHWCLVPRSKKFDGSLAPGKALGRSFRRLEWDKPSWTVAYGHREVHVHPDGHRRLSVFEAMRLQSFPDSYRLTGNMTAQIRLVSEAVPPPLARRVAESIKKCFHW